MEKAIEPVFKVTVSVSMAEVINQANEQVSDDEYGAYIPDDAFQKAILEKASSAVMRLFDRKVLDGIQALAQAEIKDQVSKKIPDLIDAALAGPASNYPEMTLTELIESEINKQFEAQGRGLHPGNGKSVIGTLIERRVEAEMLCFRDKVSSMVAGIVIEKAKETASGLVEASKAQ